MRRGALHGLPFLLVTLLLVSASCRVGSFDRKIVLSGTVVDSTSRAPLDSAWVELNDTTSLGIRYFTDTVGEFAFGTLTIGEGRLFAGKRGYRTVVKTLPQVNRDLDSIILELPASQ